MFPDGHSQGARLFSELQYPCLPPRMAGQEAACKILPWKFNVGEQKGHRLGSQAHLCQMPPLVLAVWQEAL